MDEIIETPRAIRISGCVTHSEGKGIVRNAEIHLLRLKTKKVAGEERVAEERQAGKTFTDAEGMFLFSDVFDPGEYRVRCRAFGVQDETDIKIIKDRAAYEIQCDLGLGAKVTTHAHSADGSAIVPVERVMAGKGFILRAESEVEDQIEDYRWYPHVAARVRGYGKDGELLFREAGSHQVEMVLVDKSANSAGNRAEAVMLAKVDVSEADIQAVAGNIGVSLQRTRSEPTLDQALWFAIRDRTQAISFSRYREFIDNLLGQVNREALPPGALKQITAKQMECASLLHGVGAYEVLKFATQIFLMANCGVRIADGRRSDGEQSAERLGYSVTRDEMQVRLDQYLGKAHQLPYLRRIIETAFPWLERELHHRDRVLTCERITDPCLLEFIHEYWLEEGMLMQTMNAITRRFQNVFMGDGRDPLANVEIDPLRPLNNLLFGYIEREMDRLSVRRRAFEYIHHYGMPLLGKAIAGMRATDNRSRFVEAFHNLLHQTTVFYAEDCQTTVIADGYRLLNALKEVHLILAEGAHNQFGDMPWEARVETLMMEYIIARPEIRSFLQSRAMVPVTEAWIPQVDAMKTLQGWTDVSATYFRDLAVYGEQLLLTIRYADWIGVNDEDPAKNWARFWRPEVQGYLHAYQAVTGVDLAGTVDTTPPAFLLQRRVAAQRTQA